MRAAAVVLGPENRLGRGPPHRREEHASGLDTNKEPVAQGAATAPGTFPKWMMDALLYRSGQCTQRGTTFGLFSPAFHFEKHSVKVSVSELKGMALRRKGEMGARLFHTAKKGGCLSVRAPRERVLDDGHRRGSWQSGVTLLPPGLRMRMER